MARSRQFLSREQFDRIAADHALPWMRSGLEGMTNFDEWLMLRAGSRNGRHMYNEAIYGLIWIRHAASSWLDHKSKLERTYPPPSRVRGIQILCSVRHQRL